MGKEVKTNAVRILDRNKIEYELNKYECDDFKDGVSIADMLEQSYDMSFKTLVTVGKSGKYYVFAIPVDKEINMKKAAKEVGEKNIEICRSSISCAAATSWGLFPEISCLQSRPPKLTSDSPPRQDRKSVV